MPQGRVTLKPARRSAVTARRPPEPRPPSHAVSRWTGAELARGTDRYRRYLALFGLTEDTFKYQTVCHIGCGPLGGVLSVLRGVHQAYRVDREADVFRGMGCCPQCGAVKTLAEFRTWKLEAPLLPFNKRTGRSPVPSRSCDAVFSLGDVNDTPWLVTVEREIRRICREGGKLYLWWRVADGRGVVLTSDRLQRIFKPLSMQRCHCLRQFSDFDKSNMWRFG